MQAIIALLVIVLIAITLMPLSCLPWAPHRVSLEEITRLTALRFPPQTLLLGSRKQQWFGFAIHAEVSIPRAQLAVVTDSIPAQLNPRRVAQGSTAMERGHWLIYEGQIQRLEHGHPEDISIRVDGKDPATVEIDWASLRRSPSDLPPLLCFP